MFTESTYFICEELKKRGYLIEAFPNPYVARVSKDGKRCFIHGTKTPLQKATSGALCRDKALTRQVMERDGFAIPRYLLLRSNAPQEVSKLAFPIVLKPVNQSEGRDVSINIRSEDEVRSYIQTHSTYASILAEEMLEGDDIRVLIVRGKYFAALMRIPASIEGDGTHSIEELVKRENEKRQERIKEDQSRGEFTSDLVPILYDEESKRVLREQGFSPTDIPSVGQRVFVRRNANISMGGMSVDVTDEVCPEIRHECERLVQSLDMTYAGIDIMTKDIHRPLSSAERSGFIEVNSSPGIDIHILTDVGTRRNPVPLIADEIDEYFASLG